MYLRVDLSAAPAAVSLEEPEDCKRLQVTVVGPGDPTALADALAASGLARLDDDGQHAWLFVEAVRHAADGRVGPGWSADLDTMLAYADRSGWLSAGGEEVRAHVERPS